MKRVIQLAIPGVLWTFATMIAVWSYSYGAGAISPEEATILANQQLLQELTFLTAVAMSFGIGMGWVTAIVLTHTVYSKSHS